MKLLSAYKLLIAGAVGCMVLAAASSSLVAVILGKLTDLGFYNQEKWVVTMAPIALIAVSCMHGFSMFMSNYLLGKVSQSLLKELRRQIFHKILRWPAATYQRRSSGTVSSLFVFEANVALTNAARSCIILVRDSCQVLALSITLFWNNWILAIVSLVIAPALFYLLRYISTKMKTVMGSCQSSFASIMVRVKEAFRIERLIKISGTYEEESRRFERINRDVGTMMVRMTKITALGTPVTQLICMSAVAVVLAASMYQTQMGILTIGQFVTFLAALLLLMPPLRNLAGVNAGFVIMTMASGSIFDTIDEKEEEDKGTKELTSCEGAVTFEHVSLRYPRTKTDAVHDFNLSVRPGDRVALVGLSGSGKSTLVNMLPRFWNPTAGVLRIDGVDTQDITLASLRRHIAVVSQDVVLFDDTIRNNVKYGVENADDEAVWKVLQAAALDEFVRSLPKGLDTPVGEAGGLLSGGQKQRLSIARALLKNASILILDEATSALDSESEAKVKAALERLMRGKTTFIVAHRFSTIEFATKIVVMEKGLVKECGTREALLAQNGLFAELWRLQSFGTDKTKEAA